MAVANPRDLVALKSSLRAVPPIRELLKEKSSRLLSLISSGLDEIPGLTALIDAAILDDPAPGARDGDIIRQGYDTELDELVSITRDGRKWIAALEEKERRNTGISNLRVGFNNIFGYYIEVTKANCHLVPDSYIRKQTLVNAERYINQELKEYEFTVLNAEEKRKQREYELFLKVRGAAAKEIKKIMKRPVSRGNRCPRRPRRDSRALQLHMPPGRRGRRHRDQGRPSSRGREDASSRGVRPQ